MASAIPAVVVARKDGKLICQNAPARRMMGPGAGKSCWDVVGGLKGAEGLPCETNCVRRLLAQGLEHTQQVDPRIEGREHRLTCVPVGEAVVCVLESSAENEPDQWEVLTARERDVLSLLADGDETPAVARKLGVSESTVRTHVEKMRAKLGVKTRAALVALGFRFGYLS
ncbi:MAG: helix-turn-helix transcriptional regulator [bacterium]|nr:helix-turn-helix transcriptional regulator [bacterium]MCP5068589.1 helix-turn-helix transcriptional regulator [bacterium]